MRDPKVACDCALDARARFAKRGIVLENHSVKMDAYVSLEIFRTVFQDLQVKEYEIFLSVLFSIRRTYLPNFLGSQAEQLQTESYSTSWPKCVMSSIFLLIISVHYNTHRS